MGEHGLPMTVEHRVPRLVNTDQQKWVSMECLKMSEHAVPEDW